MSSGQQADNVCLTPGMKPSDEAKWQGWLAKGRARDVRKRSSLNAAVRYAVIAVLIVAAVVWSNLAAYGLIVRFIVAAGALFVALQAFRSAHYPIAGVFGALAVVYNPVAPVFSFAGDWQRGFVLVSAFLFIVSFYWPSRRLVHA